MSQLKFVSTKGWVAPEDGFYAGCTHPTGSWGKFWVLKGDSINLIDGYVAGPIIIAPPDPELELPEGWTIRSDKGSVASYYPIISIGGIEVQSLSGTRYSRADCVTALKAALKALERK